MLMGSGALEKLGMPKGNWPVEIPTVLRLNALGPGLVPVNRVTALVAVPPGSGITRHTQSSAASGPRGVMQPAYSRVKRS